MRDRALIYGGLGIFLAVFTFPFWREPAAGVTTKGPEPARSTNARQCVAPLPYMRTSHMLLLMRWREDTVRAGRRTFTAFDGRTYTIDFTATCLNQCHTRRADFCDRCHNYTAASLTCWDCHEDAKPQPAVQVGQARPPASQGDTR